MQGIIQYDTELKLYSIKTLDKTIRVENINNDEIVFPGDIVNYDISTGKIDIIKRKTKNICGVLLTTSAVSYGFTGKGNILKKFIPNDYTLGEFLVPINVKHQLKYASTNVYCIIQYEYIYNKKPLGSLVEILGEVGNIEIERLYLKMCATSNWSSYKKIDRNLSFKDYMVDLTSDRTHIINQNIYSIDPPGCTDIDDALHIRQISNTHVEIGIHIADVSSYIGVNSVLDKELAIRGESVYLATDQINMMPDIFSTNLCSLIKGKPKRSFSLFVEIEKSTLKITKFEFKKTFICVKENLSYEKCQNIITQNDQKYLDLSYMYEFTNQYYKNNNTAHNQLENFDTHKMVEVWMIVANTLSADVLVQNIPDHAIFRHHVKQTNNAEDKDKEKENLKDNEKNLQLNSKINQIQMKRAEYVIGKNNNQGHYGLQMDYYTHFTSPIRRYADLIVHRMVYSIIDKKEKEAWDNFELFEKTFNLNRVSKKNSNLELSSLLLELVYKLNNDGSTTIENIDAYVISINENTNSITIYVPTYDINIKTQLFSDKLLNQKIVSIEKNKTSIVIKSGLEYENMIKFSLKDKIKINLILCLLSSTKKMIVQFVEPNPIQNLKIDHSLFYQD